MKLMDRERVDGTEVTIGRRVYYRNRQPETSSRYAAEYRDVDGRQVCRNLGTTNKAQARRKAIEIQQRLESGLAERPEGKAAIQKLTDDYLDAVKAKGVAPKTEWKYRADLAKLRDFCGETGIKLARQFTAQDLYKYREWLRKQDYADKTMQGAVVLAKQVFKWAWRQGILRDYRFAATTFAKAKAKPQPCFTSAQVNKLIEAGEGEEKLAFALMGYAGLRVGEVEQLQWEDIHSKDRQWTIIQVRRGGSAGVTKDKDERFVPVHPKVAELLGAAAQKTGRVFRTITERQLLKRLKRLCGVCKFESASGFKLHSFRHHFASLCANHQVAYRKALAWLGHSSSEMLNLYYHLHDEDSQAAMEALAKDTEEQAEKESKEDDQGEEQAETEEPDSPSEGSLRAMGQYRIEKALQVPEVKDLVECLSSLAEREGFEPSRPSRAYLFSRQARSTTPAPLRTLLPGYPARLVCTTNGPETAIYLICHTHLVHPIHWEPLAAEGRITDVVWFVKPPPSLFSGAWAFRSLGSACAPEHSSTDDLAEVGIRPGGVVMAGLEVEDSRLSVLPRPSHGLHAFRMLDGK